MSDLEDVPTKWVAFSEIHFRTHFRTPSGAGFRCVTHNLATRVLLSEEAVQGERDPPDKEVG